MRVFCLKETGCVIEKLDTAAIKLKEVEKVNYYDNYSYLAAGIMNNNLLQSKVSEASARMGMQTDAVVRTSNGESLCTVMYYDNRTLNKMLYQGGYVSFNKYEYSVPKPKLQYSFSLYNSEQVDSSTLASNAEYNEEKMQQWSSAQSSCCGYITSFHYYIQDHLGNNRMVINEDGTVEQVTNYYPFGGVFSTSEARYNKNADKQPYKYNGKELDRTHGLDWYDYGARNYDAIVPQFTSIDPLCEKYYNISPYVYCGNNPVMFIDPDGCKIDSTQMNDRQKVIYSNVINLCSQSSLFNSMYNQLKDSPKIYSLRFGKTSKDSDGITDVDANFVKGENGGNIVFSSKKETLSEYAVLEELFHAYQNDNNQMNVVS